MAAPVGVELWLQNLMPKRQQLCNKKFRFWSKPQKNMGSEAALPRAKTVGTKAKSPLNCFRGLVLAETDDFEPKTETIYCMAYRL